MHDEPAAGHVVGLWQRSYCSSSRKTADIGPALLVSQPTSCFLSPPHSRDSAGRCSKPSCDSMCWCVILEELDYLCNPADSVSYNQ